jgi:Zn-dependent protease
VSDIPRIAMTLLVLGPLLLAAVILHEIAHGIVAGWFGDDTAQRAGRLTLNPLRHIDPFGSVVFPIMLGLAGLPIFGWARPVPVNFLQLRNPKRDMVAVALAGPATNVVLAFISAAAARMIGPTGHNGLLAMAIASVQLNVVLAVFNLIPILPLDGGRVLFGLLPRQPAIAYARLEPYGMLIVMALLLTGMLRTVVEPLANAVIRTLL